MKIHTSFPPNELISQRNIIMLQLVSLGVNHLGKENMIQGNTRFLWMITWKNENFRNKVAHKSHIQTVPFGYLYFHPLLKTIKETDQDTVKDCRSSKWGGLRALKHTRAVNKILCGRQRKMWSIIIFRCFTGYCLHPCPDTLTSKRKKPSYLGYLKSR